MSKILCADVATGRGQSPVHRPNLCADSNGKTARSPGGEEGERGEEVILGFHSDIYFWFDLI